MRLTASRPTALERVHDSLPIFRFGDETRMVFYTPGALCAASPADATAIEAALGGADVTPECAGIAAALAERAQTTVDGWRALGERPFEPECLTVYLSNRCNLGCRYCYSAPVEWSPPGGANLLVSRTDTTRFPTISTDVVRAAAHLVASHCARKARPLSLVIHGGGEPTLHWDLLENVRRVVGDAAAAQGLSVWAYVATNGTVAPDHVRWLADNFSLIGLSCDGPPDMQNRNRSTASGGPTAAFVERTAAVLRAEGVDFHVRATVTRDTVRRQSEIVTYCVNRLGARVVRFEPAYEGRRSSTEAFGPADAETFVEHFVEAWSVARSLRCDLKVSGIRPEELHGPYCNPLRDVLQLTPDGTASACFLSTGDATDSSQLRVGQLDATTGEFTIDMQHAMALRRRAVRMPSRCRPCVNAYHCARDCPDVCLLEDGGDASPPEGFRCRVHQLLAPYLIEDMAANLALMETKTWATTAI